MFDMVWARLTTAYLELRRQEEGQALVEYALILALIAVICVGALQLLGGNINSKLNSIANSL
jgi:pilus assembly protein Flp/PilA